MDGEVVALVLVLGSGIWFVLRPIAAAIARRIAGEVPARRDERADAAGLSDVHDELATLRARGGGTGRARRFYGALVGEAAGDRAVGATSVMLPGETGERSVTYLSI